MNSIIVIGGPTASGKSSLAVELAKSFLAHDVEPVIINADSMQVYKEIPIITAQPTEKEKQSIEHLLYGCISASEPCSAGMWSEMAANEIKKQLKEGKQPILVGGSGLYIKTLISGIVETPETEKEIREKALARFEELGAEKFHEEVKKRDPEIADKLLPTNTQRLKRAWEVYEQTGVPLSEWQQKEPKTFFENPEIFNGYFLSADRETIYDNSNKRFHQMINEGAIEEVKSILEMNLPEHYPAMRAVGVPQIKSYLEGEISLDEAIEKSQKMTRNYVKRQFTWFNNQLPEFTYIQSAKDIIEERGLLR